MSGLKYIEKNEKTYTTNTYDVPLQNTTITGDITDCFGMIHVTQSYVNTNKIPIEALYLFPLKDTSSITGLMVTFGSGKKLVGDFQRKDLAKKTYTDAVTSNIKACILEKFQDSYQISIGNIEAGETVIVEYTYIVTLDFCDNAFKFVFQTNIAPKYCPTSNITTKELNDPSNNLEYNCNISNTFNLTLNCSSQNKINNITSFSHINLITTKLNDNNMTVSTNVSPKEGDLNIFIHTEIKPTLYYATKDEYVYTGLLHQIPNTEQKISNAEYIILLDRSGSMDSQDRIILACNALSKFIDILPLDTYFNIVSFGTKYDFMFPNSEKMTPENKTKCKNIIKTIKADMDGTELFNPIEKVIQMPFQNEITERNIILISDGDVGNPSTITKLIKSVDCNTRFFTIGVGKDVSRSLIEGISESGNGIAVFVNDNTIDTCIFKILDCSTKQYYKNININWNLQGNETCIETNKINVVYPNRPFILFSKMPVNAFNKNGMVTITADNGKTGEKTTWTLNYNNYEQSGIVQHYTKRLLIDIDNKDSFYHKIGTDIDDIITKATQLSIENKIVSNYVSLVLVSDDMIKTTEKMTTVKVPHYSRGRCNEQESESFGDIFVKQSCMINNLHNQCETMDSSYIMNSTSPMNSINNIVVKERSMRLPYRIGEESSIVHGDLVTMEGRLSNSLTSPKMFQTKGGSSFSLLDSCKNVFSNIKNYMSNLTQSDADMLPKSLAPTKVLQNAYVGHGLFNISNLLIKTINAPNHDIIIEIADKNQFTQGMVYHLVILTYLIETKDHIYYYDVKKYCTDYFTKFNHMIYILDNIEKMTLKEIINYLN